MNQHYLKWSTSTTLELEIKFFFTRKSFHIVSNRFATCKSFIIVSNRFTKQIVSKPM